MRGAVRSRRAVLSAATASVAVLAGLLPGAPSAASGPDGAVQLAYSCAFTAGGASDGGSTADPATVTEDATVTVQQDYPATGAVGADIRPGRLTVEVELDKDAADAALPPGTASASATGSLTAKVTQGTSTADAQWLGLRAASTPATDGLDLTFTGEATAVSVTAPGTVRFDAGRLDLALATEAASTTPPSTPATSGATAGATAGATPDAAGDTAASDTAGSGAAGSDSSAADGGSAATPDPGPTGVDVNPHRMSVTCTPKDGQATELGEVDVAGTDTGGPTPSAGGTATPSGTAGTPTGSPAGTAARKNGTITVAEPPHSGISDCPPPLTDLPDQGLIDSIPRPPNVSHFPVTMEQRQAECTFLTGLSNVGKLHGAATINDLNHHPALTNVTQIGSWFALVDGAAYLEIDNLARMDLPPSHSTFLTFGFMPTTAVMHMTQVGPMTLVVVGSSGDDYITTTTVWGKLDLRLSDIKVNGTPLDVGPNCHTVKPLDLKLTGIDLSNSNHNGGVIRPSDYNEIYGGPLFQKQLTIPPFTGCSAHGENVDALLTSSISGTDNSLNLIQGPLCIPSADLNCKPEIAYPSPPHR